MELVKSKSELELRGTIRLRTFDVQDKKLEHSIADVTTKNIICNTGLNIMLNALIWSSVNDQNVNMGSPFSYVDMTPVYGAIGTGTWPAALPTITALQTELARTVVVAAGSTAAYSTIDPSITWLFLFPVPASTTTITEAGVFFNATSSINDGSPLFDWASVLPSVVQTTSQLLTMSVQVTMGN
jgi:hypothetical protein